MTRDQGRLRHHTIDGTPIIDVKVAMRESPEA